jgi:hypothetical protein
MKHFEALQVTPTTLSQDELPLQTMPASPPPRAMLPAHRPP